LPTALARWPWWIAVALYLGTIVAGVIFAGLGQP
jgi:hypothetical protein